MSDLQKVSDILLLLLLLLLLVYT